MQTDNTNPADSEAARIVTERVAKARAAQAVYAGYTQQQVDEVVTAVAWTIMQPEHNIRLSEQAVADTRLGRVAHKITKNQRKTLGLLRDLKHARTVGVVARYPEKGLIEIARPVGVVGAIVPSTNPVATPYNKTLNALKCANAVILAPSPKGASVAEEVVELMRGALNQVGAPPDLVQKLPTPINKATTQELMHQVDLVVATGSQNNVHAAMTCGTPAIGVGAGNVPGIVDETADIEAAAERITTSKTFDHATSCSSENSIVVVDAIYDSLIRALQKQGALLLDNAQKEQLRATMWPKGKLNGAITAKPAGEILRIAGIQGGADASMILVEVGKPDIHDKFCDEKLSPVLSVFRARDFDHASQIAAGILDINGKGHSVGLHSRDEKRALQLGLKLPVCRIIVNQTHCFATGGSFDNGLPFSLSMGCGTWGGNNTSDNMHYRHYMNTTRISTAIPPNQPTLEDIFGDYWRKYGIKPPEASS